MAEAVADAGPLIHLDEVGLADALHVFRRIVVPTPVAAEIRVQPRGPGTRILSKRHVHMTRASGDEQDQADKLPVRRLSGTDRLVLVMAMARDAPLLTDDLDLRDAARTLNVLAVGTIGLVVRAAHAGRLDLADARRGLDRLLVDSSMFITSNLVERAKAALPG